MVGPTTWQPLSEDRLGELNQRVGEFFRENSWLGLGVLDEEFRVIHANRRFRELYGESEFEALTAVPFLDLIHPDCRERFLADARSVLGKEDSLRAVYRLRRRDGEESAVEALAGRTEVSGRPVLLYALREAAESGPTESALRESEEKFLSLVNDSAYGYVEFDGEGNFLFANRLAEEISGYRLALDLPLNFRDLILAEDLPRALGDLGRVWNEPNAGPREYRFRRRDGRVVDLQVNTLPLKKAGRVIGFQSTMLDVTERRLAEAELKRRAAMLLAVAQGAEAFIRASSWPDQLAEVIAQVGEAAQVSQAFLFSTHRERPEEGSSLPSSEWTAVEYDAKRKTSIFIDHALDPAGFQGAREDMEMGQLVCGLTRDLPLPAQKTLAARGILSFFLVPIYVGAEWWGSIGLNDCEHERVWSDAEIGILKALANIISAAIQRQQTEAAVMESESKYRLVVENVNDAIWTIDLNMRPTYISPSAEGLLGYSVEELLALSFEQLLTPESFQRSVQYYGEKLKENALEPGAASGILFPTSLELQMRRQDGRLIWVEVNWSFQRDHEGKISGFQAAVHDITRRKTAEEASKLNEEKLKVQYNAIPIPITTWQRQGERFVLVDYNEAAVGLTQGKVQDLLGHPAENIFIHSPEVLADFERCFRERGAFEREFLFHFDWETEGRHLAVKYVFVAPDLVLAHSEDVTEKKKALESLAELDQFRRQTLTAEVQHRRSREYTAPSEAHADFDQFRSPAFRQTIAEARLAAPGPGNLLLLGKSGVGKTYLAGWIHQHSSRAEGPFFDINCTTLSPSLIESELFGHEAGAFTGSRGRKRGLVELAHGGTLFLDEIGDLSLDLQAKLLHFLDTRQFMRLGGETKVQVDARIMVATNRDLVALVGQGRFREDLYYRLNVITILVPTLQERKEDLPLLAAELVKRLAREMGWTQTPVLGPQALQNLMDYDWPGNVRELRNVLERLLLRSEKKAVIDEVPLSMLIGMQPARADRPVPGDDQFAAEAGDGFDQAVAKFKQRLIREALAQTRSKTDAAKRLGISRHALHRYLRVLESDTEAGAVASVRTRHRARLKPNGRPGRRPSARRRPSTDSA